MRDVSANARWLAVPFLLCLGMAAPSRAALLVHEPFDYPDGWLSGQGGALGTVGTWTSNDTGHTNGWRVHPQGELTGIAVNGGYDPANPDVPGILNEFVGEVANHPTAGVLACVSLCGDQSRNQEALVRSVLSPFPTQFSVEWRPGEQAASH